MRLKDETKSITITANERSVWAGSRCKHTDIANSLFLLVPSSDVALKKRSVMYSCCGSLSLVWTWCEAAVFLFFIYFFNV